VQETLTGHLVVRKILASTEYTIVSSEGIKNHCTGLRRRPYKLMNQNNYILQKQTMFPDFFLLQAGPLNN
jgi:hypothetical protein